MREVRSEKEASQGLAKDGRERPTYSLLVLHVLLAAAMLFVALQLHVLTLSRIRAFHPDYPGRIVLAPYTPLRLVWPLHQAGPVVLSVVTAIALGGSVALHLRRRRVALSAALLAGLNLGTLLAAIWAYSLSAVQLAGVAAHLAGGGP